MKELLNVIEELKAPKNQRNAFGNYNYRSCEDILEAVKPLLKKYNLLMTITDDIVEIGGRVYVRAQVYVSNEKEFKTSHAFAREPESKKGMDESQITGAASSYARKYALNGMFLIDDSKDADSQEHAQAQGTTQKPAQKQPVNDAKMKLLHEATTLLKNNNTLSEAVVNVFRSNYMTIKEDGTEADAKRFLEDVQKAITQAEPFDDTDVPFQDDQIPLI